MRKIMLVLPSLRGGGAEKVFVTLINHLSKKNLKLHLVLINKEGVNLYEIPPEVSVHDLKKSRVRYAGIALLKIIWKIRPDTILSTLGHLNFLMILMKFFLPCSTRLIVRETTIVSSSIKNKRYKWVWAFLYKKLYKKADKVVCQSHYMLNDLQINYNVPSKKLIQIYNPVDISYIEQKCKEGTNPFEYFSNFKNIVFVGRIEKVKGLERLLMAIPEMVKSNSNIKFWILGEGILKDEMERIVKRLDLDSIVTFLGYQKNPYVFLKNADLFILSSLYEGLPNVLLEAIACGCPVVSIAHPGGTKEILEKTDMLDRFITDFKWNARWFDPINVDSKHRLEKNFSVENIVEKYSNIL